ncbi:MAG: radical SAM protein [Chloroflexi bacterium]|nr:radical SAM protein [Chloroflexota bacterium]
MEVFFVPVGDKYLLYAPLHRLSAVLNQSALRSLRDALRTNADSPPALSAIVQKLRDNALPMPGARRGALRDGLPPQPMFLGLIPTRGCNLGCPYCDFAAPKTRSAVMDVALARDAIDAYLRLLAEGGHTRGEVHFFGGEPFFAPRVVHFAVEYAAARAAAAGITLRFEATSNGLYSAARARWIASRFDTVVLSLDGPADIQERQRPSINGQAAAAAVIRSAEIFSESDVELVLRACVTHQSVQRMPEIAAWFAQKFRPSTVCFETLKQSPFSTASAFLPPDPYDFARYFDRAAQILAAYGIQTVFSGADLRGVRASFCPVGKDALIVSPDGAVAACYLLEKDWQQSGLDMHLGWLRAGHFALDAAAIERARGLAVENKPLCANCLCRLHCAGGCHVSHDTARAPGHFDEVCIQTRLITTAALLRQNGQHALADAWLADGAALHATAAQSSDRLIRGKR